MGRPQNFVSRSLWIRSCLMYLVVAGSGIGGMTLSSRTRIVAAGPRLDHDLLGRAVEVPGRPVPVLSLAAVHGQLHAVPVGAVERLVPVQQGLDPVTTGRDLAQAFQRVAQRLSHRSRPPDRAPGHQRRCRRSAGSSGRR